MGKNSIYRIIDANINRFSEALRVIEEWARFGKNNAKVSKKLKEIRHSVNLTFLDFTRLVENRDTENDVGRIFENNSIKTSIKDLIRANCKRAEEALRVLAEYGQLINLNTKILEQNRYEIYTIEKELIKNEKLIRLNNAKLYLVASRNASAECFYDDNEFLSVIEKAIEGGVDIIQLREKNALEKKILELGKEIKKIITGTDIIFIVNDRVDIAMALDADGVHLGQEDMPVSEARKITTDGFIIGLSTHSVEQGQNALGIYGHVTLADYLGVGPVFKTPTKPDYKAAGLEYVQWASKNIKNLPWFAIGGIGEENINKVIEAGVTRIAVVRSIMNSSNPKETVINLKKLINSSDSRKMSYV